MKKFSIVLTIILCFAPVAFGQDSRVRILEQPKPELPQNYGTLDVQGTVILKVQFLEFGEIGEVIEVKGLSGGLTERAIAAAKKVKFEPEKKDGKPITVYKQLEYSYSWNGGWSVPSAAAAKPETRVAGDPSKAEMIVAKAVQNLGGDRYLKVSTQVGKGKFSTIKEGTIVDFQSFVDAIVIPDRERTEFKGGGAKMTQVNTGETGWIYDGGQDLIKVQTSVQIENFKRSQRTSLDTLLRGNWKGKAELTYIGTRPASLGKRNDVVRLTYKDGFAIEFEFSTGDAMPQKAVYKQEKEGEDSLTEEDRYAQFIEVDGIKTPFIIDRFTGGRQTSRINYDSVEFNKPLPDAVFAKPANVKEARKDLKY